MLLINSLKLMKKTNTLNFTVQKNEIEEALKLLKLALTKISIYKIFRSALKALKATCEANHIQFPYTIPVSKYFINFFNNLFIRNLLIIVYLYAYIPDASFL